MTTRVYKTGFFDLDGTLLGRGGSLLDDGDGKPASAGAQALISCREYGIEAVPASGRRPDQMSELARLLGLRSYICEGGTLLVADGRDHWLGGFQPGQWSIFEQIERTDIPAWLIDEFGDRLEPHTPWDQGRVASHLFRGDVDIDLINAVLEEREPLLRMVDNGVISEHTSKLPLERFRSYHLLPFGAGKAEAIVRHCTLRGRDPKDTFFVGDSQLDLEAADVVGVCWLVANALRQDPALAEVVAERQQLGQDVRVTEASHGAGVLEAVRKMRIAGV